jgi:hypothetical protein
VDGWFISCEKGLVGFEIIPHGPFIVPKDGMVSFTRCYPWGERMTPESNASARGPAQRLGADFTDENRDSSSGDLPDVIALQRGSFRF